MCKTESFWLEKAFRSSSPTVKNGQMQNIVAFPGGVWGHSGRWCWFPELLRTQKSKRKEKFRPKVWKYLSEAIIFMIKKLQVFCMRFSWFGSVVNLLIRKQNDEQTSKQLEFCFEWICYMKKRKIDSVLQRNLGCSIIHFSHAVRE